MLSTRPPGATSRAWPAPSCCARTPPPCWSGSAAGPRPGRGRGRGGAPCAAASSYGRCPWCPARSSAPLPRRPPKTATSGRAPRGTGPHGRLPRDGEAEAPVSSPLHLPQHELTRALRATLAAIGDEDLVTDRLRHPRRDRRAGRARGQRTDPGRPGHLVAGQPPGRLRRPPVHRPQAAGHPLPRPYGGGTARRRRPARRTPLARRGRCCTARRRGARPSTRRSPPGRCRTASGGWTGCCRPGRDLVTPDALMARVRDTLAGWCEETAIPYELLDTGVHTVHHRLARRWRVGRAFLAGDAAHLLGALGTQGLEEGLRDVDNLAWKLVAAPGTTAPPTPCSTAIRRSGGRPSPRGCAPPTRRCRCCGRPAGGARYGARSCRVARAAMTRCSPTVTWAMARWARPPPTAAPRWLPRRPRRAPSGGHAHRGGRSPMSA